LDKNRLRFKLLWDRGGEYEEFEVDGVKIYIHRGALRFRKLAILLQKVLGYKSLIGYFA
jgi:hypothetical protein